LTIPQQVIREIDRTAAMARDPEAAATLRNQVFGASLSAPAEKNMHVHKPDRTVRDQSVSAVLPLQIKPVVA
jgi:hypothetical protein